MRGLKKQQPPKDVSPRDQPARPLQRAETEFRNDLATLGADPQTKSAFARATFDGLEKAKLREALYIEQGSLCVYCERRIKEGHPAPRIDHWHPLSDKPELALHWKNLYLSCPTESSCDCAKRETKLGLPWPIELSYERCVGFSSSGEMYVRTDAPLTDPQRDALQQALDTLNLNHSDLVAARKAAIDAEKDRIARDFSNKTNTTATRDQRAERARQLAAAAPLPSLVSIRIAWLNKTLGKGR